MSALAQERDAALEELRLYRALDACATDPKALINEIRVFDPSSQLWVNFRMYPPEGWEAPDLTKGPALDWFWQSQIIDWWHEGRKFLILKARQLGITWLACGYGLWLMLFRPGTKVVAYSYTEEEAKKLAVRTYAMYQSIPELLRNHVEVLSPTRSELPAEWIRVKHPDGRISSFQALPATKKHGHGEVVSLGIMDEVARMDYAREIYTAINPATSRGGKLIMISTANGVSNRETGEGNFFHHLYVTKKDKKLAYQFLPWNLEPSRDDEWYADEAMKLDDVERNQQYPLNENDAFMLSGALYFPREALDFYRGEVAEIELTGQFFITGRRMSKFKMLKDGIIEIYERPKLNGKYALGADTATGRGDDYTVGTVIDLSSGAIVALMRAKIEAPRAAIQLHYLGKWYNNAKICVERQGGYGEALIIALRDGNKNLPSYTNLYRHTKFTSGNKPMSEEYGHPMGPNMRGSILDQLKASLRDRLFPFMPSQIQGELQTFVYKDTIPSPRAQDGCNDDCVMSLGLANEMWRQFGVRPQQKKRAGTRKQTYRPPPTKAGAR
jgi:hypothetical protein